MEKEAAELDMVTQIVVEMLDELVLRGLLELDSVEFLSCLPVLFPKTDIIKIRQMFVRCINCLT